jgi:hypothetical protein
MHLYYLSLHMKVIPHDNSRNRSRSKLSDQGSKDKEVRSFAQQYHRTAVERFGNLAQRLTLFRDVLRKRQALAADRTSPLGYLPLRC